MFMILFLHQDHLMLTVAHGVNRNREVLQVDTIQHSSVGKESVNQSVTDFVSVLLNIFYS